MDGEGFCASGDGNSQEVGVGSGGQHQLSQRDMSRFAMSWNVAILLMGKALHPYNAHDAAWVDHFIIYSRAFLRSLRWAWLTARICKYLGFLWGYGQVYYNIGKKEVKQFLATSWLVLIGLRLETDLAKNQAPDLVE